MLETMAMGKRQRLAGAPPVLRSVTVTGLDVSTIQSGIVFTSSAYLFVLQVQTGQIFAAPLSGLATGTLAFSGISPVVPAGARPNAIYGRLAPVNENRMYVYIPYMGSSYYNKLCTWQFNAPQAPVVGTTQLFNENYRFGMGQVWYNGYFYYFGGRGNTLGTDMAVYAVPTPTSARTVHSTGALPPGRAYMSYARSGDKIYVAGGMATDSGAATLKDAWCYDLLTRTWSQLANMPIGLRNASNAEVIGDKLYIFGGITNVAEDVSNQLLVYDITKNTWNIFTYSELVARQYAQGFQYNGKFYLISGFSGPSSGVWLPGVVEFTP